VASTSPFTTFNTILLFLLVPIFITYLSVVLCYFWGGLITPPGNPCGLHGFHGCSMDSTDSILAVDTPKFCFHSPRTVHGQSMDCYDFYNFHGIHADSPRTPHGLSPWIIHGWHEIGLLNNSLVITISFSPWIPYGLTLH
jgi:hypothetical protein